MSNREILVNRPEVTDTQALKHKDFDKVLRSYQQTGSGFNAKWKWAGLGVVAATICGIAIWLTTDKEATVAVQPEVAVVEAITVQPELKQFTAIEGLDLGFEEFVIDAQKETRVVATSGSELSIPANALVKEDGSAVKGKVRLRFRERHDPLAFFLGGVPMLQKKAEKLELHEAVGTVEIVAEQAGEKLALKPGQKITLALAELVKGENIHVYALAKGNGMPMLAGKETAQGRLTFGGNMEPVAEPAEPQKPKLAKRSHYFELELEPEYAKKYPELSAFSNASFAVNESITPFNDELYDVSWDDVKIIKSEKAKNHFDLTLILPDTMVKVTAYQVLSEKDFRKAMQQYEVDHQVWTSSKTIAPKGKEQVVHPSSIPMELTAELAGESEAAPTPSGTIQLEQLGIVSLEKEESVTALGKAREVFFEDKKGNVLEYSRVFVLEKGLNAFAAYKTGAIHCNPNKTNVFWLMTTENQIAIAEVTLENDGTSSVVKMDLYNQSEGLLRLKELINS